MSLGITNIVFIALLPSRVVGRQQHRVNIIQRHWASISEPWKRQACKQGSVVSMAMPNLWGVANAIRACSRAQTFSAWTASAAAQRGFASSMDDKKITVEVAPYHTHKIEAPGRTVETSVGELVQMYHSLLRMRRMEIASDVQYKAKLIRGFCHLYDGQEAVLGGIEAALTPKDSIITSYRDHCHMLSRGGSVATVMAELFGKATGATKGLGGSMHMYSRKHNFYGGNGIVGAQIPLGAGIAFAHKYRKENNVCVAMYGDGAANQGQKYEALNMAGLWDMPVIFVCENNHYGMGTAEWRAAKSATFYTRGDYIPGIKADGMDVLAVKNVVAYAKQYALEKGPIILELDTYRDPRCKPLYFATLEKRDTGEYDVQYWEAELFREKFPDGQYLIPYWPNYPMFRYHGHSMSDPGSTYRTRDEINAIRQQRDPVERVKKLLLENGYAAEDLKAIEKEVKQEVDAAVDAAKKAPIPPMDWLWRNVYVDPSNVELRKVQGDYIKPAYSTDYAI